jgi:catechol-2,3-dioxygenase
MKADRIFETSLYGDDLDVLQEFYTRVLGLEVLQRFDESGVSLRCGAGVLLLFDAEKTATLEREVPAHGARGEGHIAFAVPGSELDAWRTHLARHRVPIETEVAWASGGRSIYFRDPAGNSVELAPPTLWGMPAP